MIFKRLIAFVLFFALVSPLALKNYLITHYVQNIEIITQKYCVNKDKPELHCNGKCYLAKEFKMFGQSMASKDINNSKTVPQLLQLDLRFVQLNDSDLLKTYLPICQNKMVNICYLQSTLIGYFQQHFKPPQRLF